jgi:hypothetical protein
MLTRLSVVRSLLLLRLRLLKEKAVMSALFIWIERYSLGFSRRSFGGMIMAACPIIRARTVIEKNLS